MGKKGQGNYLLPKFHKARKCKKCNRTLRKHNKSGLCNKHSGEIHDKIKNDKRKINNGRTK